MTVQIIAGDCRDTLATLDAGSVHCCVTSPPYFGLRDYGHAGQIGMERTTADYVAELSDVFAGVWRALRDDGTLWLNLGDSYGSTKQLLGVPWRVAFALQERGWILRQDIIWSKPNPMPESVRDRCTKAHEYVFMFSKSAHYFYDQDAIKEPAIYAGLTGQDDSGFKDAQTFAGKHGKADKQRGHSRRHAGFNERWDAMSKAEQCGGMRNKRSVWEIATKPFADAHFATMAPELAETCIKAGCPVGGTVLDPFGGAGTTGLVADRLQRSAILCELNPEYIGIANRRIVGDAPLFAEVHA
jgi:DNA modification methylase